MSFLTDALVLIWKYIYGVGGTSDHGNYISTISSSVIIHNVALNFLLEQVS